MASASQPDLIREERGEYRLTPEQQAEKETFRARLRAFLEDPASRQIEGFPIGEIEDILALSTPIPLKNFLLLTCFVCRSYSHTNSLSPLIICARIHA